MGRFCGLVTVLGLAASGCGGDEPTIDGEVTVSFEGREGAPRTRAVTIVTASASGELAETIETDDTTVTRVPIEAGGSLTAFRGRETITYLGVQPGDELVAGARLATPGDERPPIALAWQPLAGADTYGVVHACSELELADRAATLAYTADCAPGATTDVLALAYDSYELAGYAYLRDVGLGDAVEVEAASWRTPQAFTYAVEHAADVESYWVEVYAVVGANARLLLRRDLVGARSPAVSAFGTFAPAAATWVHAGIHLVEWSSTQVYVGTLDGAATAWSVDTRDATPPVRGFFYDEIGRTAWWQRGDGVDEDGVVLQLRWWEDPAWNDWTIVAPPGTDTIALPEIGGTPAGSIDAHLRLLDLDAADGYDDLRRRRAWQLAQPSELDVAGASYAEPYRATEASLSL